MDIKALYNLIEMLPEAAHEYITTKLTGNDKLIVDEVNLLIKWITKLEYNDQPDIIKNILYALNFNSIKYIKNSTIDEQLLAIEYDPLMIKHIKNPDPAIQMAAVERGGSPSQIYNMIDNPCEDFFFELVKEKPDHIIKMENPSEKLQIEAITQNPFLITYSSTAWGDTARTMAFDANHDNFKYLKNPTDEQCKKALTYKPEQIVYIENPAEEYQIFAIAIKPALIVLRSIEWSETCQRMAFEADYDNFKYLKTPTVEECWAALEHDPSNIRYIENPLPEMKSYAVLTF